MDIFKLVGSVFVDTDEANKSLAKTDKSAESLGSKFVIGIGTATKWAAKISAAAGIAAIAITTKAVSAASEFEDSFAKVNTLLADGTDLNKYKDNIVALSNETGVATDELCESIYSAISAGVDQSKAIDFTANALKLAEGGFTDAATAVDVMTTAVNAYGLSADDASQVSDYLISTQNMGKTTVDELASSLGKVIPVASAYGVSMDDLSTNMAVMTKNGIATAEATTYTKAMLNELGDSGSNVGKILQEKTGKTFAELKKSGKSLGDIIDVLGDSVDGDKSAFNGLWSSSEAGVGALSLLSTGADEYNGMLSQMQESAGATETAYDKMHNTFSTKMEQIKTVAGNALIEVGQTMMPFASKLLDWVINNIPMIQEIIQLACDGLQIAVTFLGDTFNAVFSVVQSVVSDTGITFQDVGAAIQLGIQNCFIFIQECWDTVGKPVFDFIMQVVGVVAGYFAQKMPEIEAFVSAVFNDISNIWKNTLQPCFKAIGDFLNNVLAPIFEFVFVHLIAPYIDSVFNNIVSLWNDTLKPVFVGIVDFVKNVFTGNFTGAFRNILEIVKGIWDGLINIIKTPINTIIGIINSFMGGIKSGINSVIDTLNGLQIKVPEWVTDLTGVSDFGFNLKKIPDDAKIPLLAKGGTAIESGRAIVGEAGAELIDLPAGARVTPLTNGQKDIIGTDKILQEIVKVLQRMDTLIEVTQSKGMVVLDTGVLVGQIAPELDSRLGILAKREERGI